MPVRLHDFFLLFYTSHICKDEKYKKKNIIYVSG